MTLSTMACVDCESCLEYSALSALMELNSIDQTTKRKSNIVTWDDVRNATTADTTIQTILQLVATGFPTDARTLPAPVRPYHSLSSSLYELDGVLMLSERIVIPPSLRPAILNLLHAAHQGIDRMKARASDTVFWPGMTGDISRVRWECMDCHKMAKSNPQAPPASQPSCRLLSSWWEELPSNCGQILPLAPGLQGRRWSFRSCEDPAWGIFYVWCG